MKKNAPRADRVAAVDGLRALSMLAVMGFHFWQQSWLQGIFPADLLAPLGVSNFSLTWIPRTGYLFVDVLLLISGFCLFLPEARRMADPLAPAPDAPGVYFKKRLVRILPCYWLVLAVFLLFWVRPSNYASPGDFWLDTLSHFTCTQVFFPKAYYFTQFPTSLWTVSVEMQFYLIFPLLARLFRRFPLLTWGGMSLAAESYLSFRARLPEGMADPFRINQLPAMLGVYANGMLAAVICMALRQSGLTKRARRAALCCAAALYAALVCMLRDGLDRAAQVQRWQIDYRFCFSALMGVFLILLDCAPRPVERVFSSRAVGFVSLISYNLYLWHQTVMLKLKEWHFPPYPDGGPDAYAWPQSAAGAPWHSAWQWQYAALFWAVSFTVAALATYGFERPVARLLLRRRKPAGRSAPKHAK